MHIGSKIKALFLSVFILESTFSLPNEATVYVAADNILSIDIEKSNKLLERGRDILMSVGLEKGSLLASRVFDEALKFPLPPLLRAEILEEIALVRSLLKQPGLALASRNEVIFSSYAFIYF